MATQAFVWSGSISQNADANAAYTLGLRFELLAGNTLPCVGVRYRVPATLSSTPGITVALWRFADQVLLASKAHTTQLADAGLEVDVLFDTPVTLDDGNTAEYIAGVLVTGTGGTVRYPTIGSYPVPATQDPLFAGLAAFRFSSGASLTFPASGTSANFLVSPIVSVGGETATLDLSAPAATFIVAATAASTAVLAGAAPAATFTATGGSGPRTGTLTADGTAVVLAASATTPVDLAPGATSTTLAAQTIPTT